MQGRGKPPLSSLHRLELEVDVKPQKKGHGNNTNAQLLHLSQENERLKEVIKDIVRTLDIPPKGGK